MRAIIYVKKVKSWVRTADAVLARADKTLRQRELDGESSQKSFTVRRFVKTGNNFQEESYSFARVTPSFLANGFYWRTPNKFSDKLFKSWIGIHSWKVTIKEYLYKCSAVSNYGDLYRLHFIKN